ncbi:MAG: vitamin B12-dependent ribonucleotide reductase, partial [Terrabacter sp.]
TRSFMGIHTAEERARQVETGSYEATEASDDEDDDELAEELETLQQSTPVARKEIPVAKSEPKAEKAGSVEVKFGAGAASAREASGDVHSSAELLEKFGGITADAPICMTCGTKMRPAGSCYVCEGCGSTSGCS